MKKLLCALFAAVFAFSLASCAMGEPYLKDCHYSLAGITDGKADFSNARFHRVWLQIESYDTIATEAHLTATGTLTLEGGTYSLIENSLKKTFSGTSKSFDVTPNMSLGAGDASYKLVDDSDNYIRFFADAETGLPGTHVKWEFPDMPSLNGEWTIENFKTTEEQLADFAPYVEIVSADGQATGINWRLVDVSDFDTPVSRDYRMRVRVNVHNGDSTFYRGTRVTINEGETLEGSETFSEPVSMSDVYRIEVMLYPPTGLPGRFIWRFYNLKNSSPVLFVNHRSNASLINGKSDYRDAEFAYIYMGADDEERLAEEKYFNEDGRMKIPAGTYTLKDSKTKDTLNTITLAAATDFKLRLEYECDLGDNWVEYQPIDDSGNLIAFGGENATSNLSGKTITWTFPDELNFSGSGTVPTLKTTEEQLATGVPYIEVESADNMIKSIKYKFVKSSDVATAVNIGTNELRLSFQTLNGDWIYSQWFSNTSEGTWTLDTPQYFIPEQGIRARIRTYEDPANPALYQWNFYPAEDTPQTSGSLTITNSSLASGVVGNYYLESLKSSSGDVTWSKTGNLPAGLTLSSQGVISGTPTTSGTSIFNVTAASNDLSVSKDFSITINPLAITTSTLPSGKVNENYSASLASNGSNFSWVVSSGTLPDGLTINASNGTISGKPTTAKEYSFTVRAYNSYASTEKTLTLKIESVSTPSIGGKSSGGCSNIGFDFLGLSVLAALILKRKNF